MQHQAIDTYSANIGNFNHLYQIYQKSNNPAATAALQSHAIKGENDTFILLKTTWGLCVQVSELSRVPIIGHFYNKIVSHWLKLTSPRACCFGSGGLYINSRLSHVRSSCVVFRVTSVPGTIHPRCLQQAEEKAEKLWSAKGSRCPRERGSFSPFPAVDVC